MVHPSDIAPVLTGDELRRFCEFLYARTGMQFGETKRYYIERRLHELAARLGIADQVRWRGFRDDVGDELTRIDGRIRMTK